jgi:hypothetical protein
MRLCLREIAEFHYMQTGRRRRGRRLAARGSGLRLRLRGYSRIPRLARCVHDPVFVVPEIIAHASGKQVLTMEMLDGVAVTKVTDFTSSGRFACSGIRRSRGGRGALFGCRSSRVAFG